MVLAMVARAARDQDGATPGRGPLSLMQRGEGDGGGLARGIPSGGVDMGKQRRMPSRCSTRTRKGAWRGLGEEGR